MDLAEFHGDLINSVATRADALALGWREAFVLELLERLREAGEIPEAEICLEQLDGPYKRRLVVDAFGFDETDDSLNLFVAIPSAVSAPRSY
ncbi:hypothetical protein [Tistlia consotensis]|uniref:hypothetical protein n=1 Tax=Tistlia consotensis TaxID=1321365 RepID=UPI00118163C7|nr:hypothetical protein [Tistlia consotensis]